MSNSSLAAEGNITLTNLTVDDYNHFLALGFNCFNISELTFPEINLLFCNVPLDWFIEIPVPPQNVTNSTNSTNSSSCACQCDVSSTNITFLNAAVDFLASELIDSINAT